MKENVVLFASPLLGKLVKTHLRIYTELVNRGVKCYSIDCRTAKVLEPGKIQGKVAKMEGDQVIEFDPACTACVVSNGIVGNKHASEFVDDLEDMGVYVVNSLDGINIARNKENYDRICKKFDIPAPKTVLVTNPGQLEKILPDFQFPIVCKTTTGSLGVGVFKVDKPTLVKPIFQAMWKLSPDLKNDGILIQEFIPNHGDIRTIVVGGQIIGSMKRIAKEGDFRNNFSQGGSVENYSPSYEEQQVILKAAKNSKCEICGVDHILAEDGKPYVIEVNSCPGTDGFMTVHHDVIDRMADFVLSKCKESTKTRIIGAMEKVDLEEVGELEALMDMSERRNSVLDARDIDMDDQFVTFTSNNRRVKLPVHDVNTYIVNGVYHKVPVVKLDMKLGGTTFENIPFELVNRQNKKTPVLLSKSFLTGHKYLIDPNKANSLLKESVELDQDMLDEPTTASFSPELTDEALVVLFSLTQPGPVEEKPLTQAAVDELKMHEFITEDNELTDAAWEYLTSETSIERLENLRNGVEEA